MSKGQREPRNSVSEEEAEQFLRELVSIPSLSGEEKQASQYLANWMGERGYRARVDEAGNAIGERGHGGNQIVLLGHIDTVPGTEPVRVEGRELYGRGSVDAKGPLATFAVAAAEVDLPADTRLIVIGATDEESGSRGARHILDRYRPVFCIIGEPSSWDRVTLGYKGHLKMEWSWRGPLAHSAGPAASPAEVAIQTWRSVQDYAEGLNAGQSGSFRRLEPTLTQLNTGRNGAEGWARMEIILRLPPEMEPGKVESGLRELVGGAQMQFHGHEQAFVAEKSNPLTRAILAAVRAEGGTPRFVHKTGTSDMNVVAGKWSCPIVAYGPGDSSLDHTPQEHINLDEYHRASRVLRRALQTLVGQAESGEHADTAAARLDQPAL